MGKTQMNLSFEVNYFDPKGKVCSSAVGEGWHEERGSWRNPELGLQFDFRLKPDANGTMLRIPADSLLETGNCKFKDLVVVNPDFSCCENRDGKYLIPWASGYLCRTSGHDCAQYELPLFNETAWNVSWGNMPLYAFFRNGGACMGLIEGGKLDAGLRLRTAWGSRQSYSLDAVFNIREKAVDDALDEDMTILFTQISGDWKDAAKWYRKYNREVRKLRTIAERCGSEPDLDYSSRALTVRCRLAVKPLPTQILEQTPENEPVPRVFLTYENIRTIAEEFHRQGVGPAEFSLVGWGHGGHDGAFPQLFPTVDGCGSEQDLRDLIAEINRLGYHISLHDNYYDGYTLARNFSLEDVCRDSGEYGGPVVGGGRLGGGQAYRVCPQKALGYAEANFREVNKRLPGLHGPYFVDVISIIAMRRCAHPVHPIDRRDNSIYYKKILKLQHDSFGISMSEGVRDWALPELDRAYMIYNLDQVTEPFCDEHIPFYQMVYHGILLYNNCRLQINEFPGSRRYLENLSWGGLPMIYFHHRYNPAWDANSGWGADLTFEGPEKLKRDAAAVKRMTDDLAALASTQKAFLDDFIIHNDGAVAETLYSNGVRVFVNYDTEEAVLPGGIRIPARDIAVKS